MDFTMDVSSISRISIKNPDNFCQIKSIQQELKKNKQVGKKCRLPWLHDK